MYQKTTLDNGLRVLTSAMPHTRSASILIFYKVGARYEPKEISGISHYIEHMLFKGTHKRPTAQEISEAIEGLGGSLNAATGREYTSYSAIVPSQHFALALDVLTDMLRNSRFDEEEVEHERAVITEEINGTLDSPPDIVNQVLDEIMWGDQPIGRPIAGTRETVEAITRGQMLDYMAGHYLPGANLVSVAGNIEHEQVVDAVRASLGAAPSGPVPIYTPAINDQTSQRMRIFNKDTEQAQICIGMPALSYTDPDRYVQQMLDGVLGSGMSSRLFVEIREKRALAYSVASYVESYKDIGAFILYAAVDNERVESCIQGMLHELDRMRQTPVPVEELNKVKEYHKGHMLLALESSRSVAAWGGRQELLLDRIYSVDEVIERIDAVTPEDVQKLAQRIFQEQLLSLSMVGPFDDEERFRHLLQLA